MTRADRDARRSLLLFIGVALALTAALTVGLVALTPLLRSTPATADPNAINLPTVANLPQVCAEFGGGTIRLAGDPQDTRIAWETALDGAGRQDIVWPPGYRARFTPELEILDPSGRVIARAGDEIPAGGCVAGTADNPSSIILVEPQRWNVAP